MQNIIASKVWKTGIEIKSVPLLFLVIDNYYRDNIARTKEAILEHLTSFIGFVPDAMADKYFLLIIGYFKFSPLINNVIIFIN